MSPTPGNIGNPYGQGPTNGPGQIAGGITPPPPPNPFTNPQNPTNIQLGGNRGYKHIVGGVASNVSYAPGADLLAARQGFQDNQQASPTNTGLARGFFNAAPEVAPDFSQTGVNAMPAGQAPTQSQALGNTLHQNSLGNVRALTAPSGLGFGRSNALGSVLQHTLTGNEALDSGMSYTPTQPAPVAPPPPPPAPTTNGGPVAPGGTGVTQPPPPNGHGAIPAGTVKVQTPPPPLDLVVAGPQAVVGGKLRDGTIFGGRIKMSNGSYAVLVKGANGVTFIHPSWTQYMKLSGLTLARDVKPPADYSGWK